MILWIIFTLIFIAIFLWLVWRMISYKKAYNMPNFLTYDEFQKSKWFSYIQNVYGSVPQPNEFPLDLSYFAVLYQSFLDKSRIDIKKYILSSIICPNKQNQLFTNMGWDPPDIVHLAKIPPYAPVNSSTWVEVIHCGSGENDPNLLVGNWMYIAPGSGIFFYVGNTISFPDHQDAVTYFLGEQCMWKGKPDKTECDDQFVRLFNEAKIKGYDSIQFIAHGDQRCGLMSREIIDVIGNSNFSCGDQNPTEYSYNSRYKSGWNHTRDCNCSQNVSTPYSGCLNCALFS
jgi:hypothetical protein